MSRKFALLAVLVLLGGTLGALTTSTSFAQGVYFGPEGGIHVRAPFVRVDVYPRGGVSVRAPFAAVDVPPRPYYYGPPPMVIERPVAQPAFPTAEELAAMDDETLRQTVRSIADRLHDRLARFDTGDTWQRYLRLRDDIIADPSPAARGEATARLLQRFSDIAADERYGTISGLPAFTAMQSGLAELLSRSGNASAAPGAAAEELPAPQHPTSERSLLQESTK